MPKGKPKLIQDIKSNNLKLSTPDKKELERVIKNKVPVVVLNLQDIKLLISRVMLQLQKETIDIVNAKAILYATTCYVNAYKESDFEFRLREIENRLGVKVEIGL